jgi:hypothetical protein
MGVGGDLLSTHRHIRMVIQMTKVTREVNGHTGWHTVKVDDEIVYTGPNVDRADHNYNAALDKLYKELNTPPEFQLKDWVMFRTHQSYGIYGVPEIVAIDYSWMEKFKTAHRQTYDFLEVRRGSGTIWRKTTK